MFQSFDVTGGRDVGRRNLPKLRRAILAIGLDGFLVPHEDEYQNEYLPAANERLAWATGFTGSAGAALVLADKAILFVDGRYTLQAKAQTDPALIEIRDLVLEGVSGWLREHAPSGARIGYDPKLSSPDAIKRMSEAAAARGAHLVSVPDNPIDAAWTDRPPMPAAPAVPHPVSAAGESHEDKRARLGKELGAQGVDAALLTSPASIAWLFNIRGGDVAHTPLPLGAGILYADGSAELFLAPAKVTLALKTHLGNAVSVSDETAFEEAISGLAGKTVRVDPASASAWVFERLEAAGAKTNGGPDPTVLPRACKNAVEVEGARQAHIRDGAALSRFLHWLAKESEAGAKIDEIDAAVKLERFRAQTGQLKDLSFDSISSAGPNGAVVHYRVTTKTNRRLKRGTLFLIDSGGQYTDGTTDVTRTIAVGRPSKEMRERFTLVLKGHIALARVRFPTGATGSHLDALARQFLWSAGLDYDHGTGHGVGSYLGVHEGPQRISKLLSDVALRPGMIVSNEPGYYKADAYGIRIENLQVVTPAAPVEGGEREMLGFETLTMAPLDRKLIVKAMLSKEERAWLDGYHATVWERVGPLLEGEAKAWLEAQCAPL
jgi:Xaa-Pro aminopeptidase